MKTGKPIIYWDACVFIAWIKDETCWPIEVLDGIQDAVDLVTRSEAKLLTSTMTRTEIFQGDLDTAQKAKLSGVLRRRNVSEVSPNVRISDRASVIREYYEKQNPRRKIKTPDAIHVATAIIYEATEMLCLDGFDANGKHNKLLALNGNVMDYALKIVPPYRRTARTASLFRAHELRDGADSGN